MPNPAKLRIWLITVGEPLPLPGARDRLLRTGLLAGILTSRGHEVLWWTSNFDHFKKRAFVASQPRVASTVGATLQFLDGRPYRRNISFDRIVNHAQNGRAFARLAANEPRPDVILCSFPTIELSHEAVELGNRLGVPVVLDVRDLWPDIFLDAAPAVARPLGRLLLSSWFRRTARSFANCDAIFAVSAGYLEWGLRKAGRGRRDGDSVYPLGYELPESGAGDEQDLWSRLAAAGVARDALLVTFVGSFGRTYDLKTLIEAARQLSGIDRPVAFVFCGAGEREAEWRAAASGMPGVVFTGWLGAGELAALLRASHIGVAAYAAGAPQGIPNKVIEYLAAGLPILCSLTGESRELLEGEGCGRYYAAGDAAGLAAALGELLLRPALRHSMSESAQRIFEQRFSAAHVFGQMADDLEALARTRRKTAN